jgi:D-alanine-D-alanine ligase-like ATP-grasp enzyme
MFRKYCKDCGLPNIHHFQTWGDEIMNMVMPRLKLSKKLDTFFDIFFEKTFSFIGLINMKDDFLLSEIQMRSACFIEEARKRGIKFAVAKGPLGYTNFFRAEINDKKIRFENLPVADYLSKEDASFVDCKERTKNHLIKGNFPVAGGKAFWFWSKSRALEFGSNKLGFPLVVKPRGGSVARHVTTNIKNSEELKEAIKKAVIYSPAFIVERFIENSFVYRATVVDFDYVAVVKQVHANVIGDGSLTIQELVERKNIDKRRGFPHQKEFTLYKITIDETTTKMLSENNYNLQSIPKKNEFVYLQSNPFLKLGGDLVEVTENVHTENVQLFKDIAIFFDIRLVGIDFLIPDIYSSWKNQNCAVLELNSVPCIEMHHFPSSGKPQNVAGALVDSFFKYYL